ncbi:hypothetical protein [Selenomonas ruminis]|uniref:Tubulin/FtsZ 2-layer sandwich domain-containing protein n=1 Tax=Selenomonas ruminis TaxID=2593411 RepID=A0A5D6W539_9FIRM|nr:hypothetical protein [Selenomonas sp. mPRGC5]TYZ22920.1 hypothetical protein FZ040_06795 [Selenomonas sp. mPRGC5]
MFTFDETILAASLKIAGIGKTHALLEQYLNCSGICLLTEDPTLPVSWADTTVGFLVADATEEHAWEKFQQGIQSAKEQKVLLLPMLITAQLTESASSFMQINPQYFIDEAELYAYIAESIKSIQSFISEPGLVNIDLEDIRFLFTEEGRFAFSYGERESQIDKCAAARMALKQLRMMNPPIPAAKYIILNITGSEDNLSMFEIQEICEFVNEELGTNSSCIIWGANIDNTLADRIYVSIWVKF